MSTNFVNLVKVDPVHYEVIGFHDGRGKGVQRESDETAAE